MSNKHLSILMYSVLISIIVILIGINHVNKIKYTNTLAQLDKQYQDNLKGLKIYKSLYSQNEKQLNLTTNELKNVNDQFNSFKETVAMSQKIEKSISRGGDYNIAKFQAITVDDLNAYIKTKAPSDSPFINQGQIFIKASKESGLDPKFIFSLASLESNYGKSQIARDKNNYFGIAAYNASPYESSQSFNGGLESGIVNGAIWISKNYSYDGNISLNSMEYGEKTYCQKSDGSPNTSWIANIVSIMN